MIQLAQILCPVDFSEFSRRALDHAIALAAWYGARLTVLHVVSKPSMVGRPAHLWEAEHARIMADIRRLTAHVPPGVRLDVRLQEAADIHREILRQADATQADLIVIGSRGLSGAERLRLGSVAESVMHDARCPTMVVPRRAPGTAPEEPVRFRRILCPVDFSQGSALALDYALNIAEGARAQLTLLHVIETPPQPEGTPSFEDGGPVVARVAAESDHLQRLHELVPEAAHTYCTVKAAVRRGVAHAEILKFALQRGIDLIVMGVRGRGAPEGMVFGSNTAYVSRAATCPVLIVRLDSGV